MQQEHPIPIILDHACDCHVHVFDPDRFPYAAKRAYTPGQASVSQLRSMHRSIGMSRTVLVQPSVYGTDNACLLDAIDQLGIEQARGVAVVNLDSVSPEELNHLHQGGVRGIRLNLHVSGEGLQQVKQQIAAAKRLAAMPGWHLQVHASLDLHVAMLDAYASLAMPIVLDHFAGGTMPDPDSESHLIRLLDAMRTHPIYVKLSAAYRLWSGCTPANLARAFYSVAPDKVLWASDWPHTGGAGGAGRKPEEIEPFRDIDNQHALNQVIRAINLAEVPQKILVDNPARLYGFSA